MLGKTALAPVSLGVRCQITSGYIGVAIALIFSYDARNLMILKILSQ
jgi:hypothetical protein